MATYREVGASVCLDVHPAVNPQDAPYFMQVVKGTLIKLYPGLLSEASVQAAFLDHAHEDTCVSFNVEVPTEADAIDMEDDLKVVVENGEFGNKLHENLLKENLIYANIKSKSIVTAERVFHTTTRPYAHFSTTTGAATTTAPPSHVDMRMVTVSVWPTAAKDGGQCVAIGDDALSHEFLCAVRKSAMQVDFTMGLQAVGIKGKAMLAGVDLNNNILRLHLRAIEVPTHGFKHYTAKLHSHSVLGPHDQTRVNIWIQHTEYGVVPDLAKLKPSDYNMSIFPWQTTTTTTTTTTKSTKTTWPHRTTTSWAQPAWLMDASLGKPVKYENKIRLFAVHGHDMCRPLSGLLCLGNNLMSHPRSALSHMDCCNLCMRTFGCRAWSWNFVWKLCYLKSHCGRDLRYIRDAMSGYQEAEKDLIEQKFPKLHIPKPFQDVPQYNYVVDGHCQGTSAEFRPSFLAAMFPDSHWNVFNVLNATRICYVRNVDACYDYCSVIEGCAYFSVSTVSGCYACSISKTCDYATTVNASGYRIYKMNHVGRSFQRLKKQYKDKGVTVKSTMSDEEAVMTMPLKFESMKKRKPNYWDLANEKAHPLRGRKRRRRKAKMPEFWVNRQIVQKEMKNKQESRNSRLLRQKHDDDAGSRRTSQTHPYRRFTDFELNSLETTDISEEPAVWWRRWFDGSHLQNFLLSAADEAERFVIQRENANFVIPADFWPGIDESVGDQTEEPAEKLAEELAEQTADVLVPPLEYPSHSQVSV